MARFSLADLKDFLSVNDQVPFWVGIDVHKRTYHVALLRDHQDFYTWSTPSDNGRLVQQLMDMNIRIAGVCHESGPTGFSLARLFQDTGIPIVVAAPNKIPRSVSAGSKTDRLDCIKLARLVSAGLVKSIAIPTPTEEYERAFLRRRQQLTDRLRECKQRIKAMFLFHGFTPPQEIEEWQSGSADVLLAMDLPDAMKMTLENHVRELVFLKKERSTVTIQLNQIGRNSEHRAVTQALKSVPGVGDVVANTFLLEIFNPGRFDRKEQVAGYIGLAPMVHHSGEKTPRGHLVPVGQTRLRSLLVEAAWIWRSRDQYAADLYDKLYRRTKVPQKAITALARRLAIILWRLSIEQRAYRPLAA